MSSKYRSVFLPGNTTKKMITSWKCHKRRQMSMPTCNADYRTSQDCRDGEHVSSTIAQRPQDYGECFSFGCFFSLSSKFSTSVCEYKIVRTWRNYLLVSFKIWCFTDFTDSNMEWLYSKEIFKKHLCLFYCFELKHLSSLYKSSKI